MSRLLFHLLPLLLPFLVYVIYVLLTRRAKARGTVFEDTPWYWLIVTGLVLAIAGFVALGLFGEGATAALRLPTAPPAGG